MRCRVALADVARDYIVRHHGEDGLGWSLDVGMGCLYDIYDEWMTVNGITPERRARSAFVRPWQPFGMERKKVRRRATVGMDRAMTAPRIPRAAPSSVGKYAGPMREALPISCS